MTEVQKNKMDIDVSAFRALNTVNGTMFASKVEDDGSGILKVFHPYWLFIDHEEEAIQLISLDPWNSEEHILLSKDKVLFQTPIGEVAFAVEFRECLKSRFLDDSSVEIKKENSGKSKVVSILDRNRFN